jgi:hypothetical protein
VYAPYNEGPQLNVRTLGTITVRSSSSEPRIPGPAVAPGQNQISATIEATFEIKK